MFIYFKKGLKIEQLRPPSKCQNMALELSVPLVTAVVAVIATLLPTLYKGFQNVFFAMPDDFVAYVNTTIVPRFGDNGGKIVLAAVKAIALIFKTYGHVVVFIGKQVVLILSTLADPVKSFFTQVKNSSFDMFLKLALLYAAFSLAVVLGRSLLKKFV